MRLRRLVVTFDDAASEASVHGSVGRSAVHLGLRRPQVMRSILPGLQIGLPSGRIEVTGRYAGPPPLLALLVGTLLRFV